MRKWIDANNLNISEVLQIVDAKVKINNIVDEDIKQELYLCGLEMCKSGRTDNGHINRVLNTKISKLVSSVDENNYIDIRNVYYELPYNTLHTKTMLENNLTPIESTIMYFRFFKLYSVKDISIEMNMEISDVNKIIRKSLDKLKMHTNVKHVFG